MAINPRWKTGRRRKYRARFKAMQAPCAICGGRVLGEIDYNSSDPKNPRSFVIDEIIPISRWREAGYNSPEECADDFNNLQAAHRWCNAQKGNKMNYTLTADMQRKNNNKQHKRIVLDGEW